jgi:hypothetical protein
MRRSLIIASLAFIYAPAFSQFRFQGVGIFGALTSSAHYYKNLDWENNNLDTNFSALYPQSHISKERLSWGAGAFLELGGSRLRWQTELEYCNKGANEMEVVNPRTGQRSGVYSPNKLTYIQWNNYAKFYFPLGFAHWYVMPGVRLEYLFRSAPTVFVPVSGDFPRFWFSGDVGLGYEVPVVKRISAFVEGHWNPDVIRHSHGSVTVRNRTLELRIGLVLRPRKKNIDDCNAPIYKGPAY